jgi:glutaredoxin
MAKDFFAKNNIKYEEKNVATDMQAREEMLDRSQQLGVPVIEVDDTIIIGFDKKNLEMALGLGATAAK